MNAKRAVLVAVVAAMLVLAGCTGGDDVGDAGDGTAIDAGDAPEEAVDRDDTAGGGSADDGTTAATGDGFAVDAAARDRQLIRTGEVRLTVETFSDADAEVRRVADAHGGFVSDADRETRDRGDDSFTVGELTLRVPSDDFDAVMADVEAVGAVERSATESRDVSEQLADLDARLENRRAERDRLRELYEDAERTEDVLAVQSELTATQEEIERLEARQTALRDRVALSTIRVRLSEEPPEPEEPEAWYDTGVAAAFLESVSGVGTVLRASVVGAAYAAPYAVVFGLPLVAIGFAARRFGGRLPFGTDE